MTDFPPLNTLTDDAIRTASWYYQVELRPGVYTGGRERHTASMVREILEDIDPEGSSCLDVGTQEAVIPVCLSRLGAETVVTYDRLDLSDRITLVKEAYDVDSDYRPGLLLSELPGALDDAGYAPFDVVVFAGMLYHMIDPQDGLGTVRGFVREGGLVLVETAAIVSEEMVFFFNAEGRFYPGSTYLYGLCYQR